MSPQLLVMLCGIVTAGGVLYSALLIMLMVSLANLFFHWRTLDLLISGCGALLFSAYLVSVSAWAAQPSQMLSCLPRFVQEWA